MASKMNCAVVIATAPRSRSRTSFRMYSRTKFRAYIRAPRAPTPKIKRRDNKASTGTLFSRGSLPLLLRGLPRTFRHAVPAARRLRLGLGQPVLPEFRRAAEDPLEDVRPILRRLRIPRFRADLQLAQPREHRLHRLLRIEEELAAAPPHEPPAEPLEDGLPRHVLAKLVER